MGSMCCSSREKGKTYSADDIAIFVLGTTGVGKSKLAMDLANWLGGEIVNADSM